MITSITNGRVKYVQTLLEKSKFRKKEGRFVSEGIKMFDEAPLDSICEVYVSESALPFFENKTKEKLEKTSYEILTDAVFKKLSDTVTPQGILTVLKMQDYDLKDMIKDENSLVILLENIQDPGNIGTIIRTAEGAGVTAIVMTKDCVDIYNPKVIRSTMGSIFREKFCYTEDIKETINLLKEKGIGVYACALSKDSKAYDEYDYKKGTAFVIGNEGNGLKKDTIEASSNVCYIPMQGKVESLNASVAASLVMYEAFRQRRQ